MDDLDLGATIKGFAPGQKVFARYALQKILGRGGMGVVWLARDEELSRDTALKFLPEVVAADRAAIEDMKREVRRAIDLAHPHIVKIHDFVTDGRTAAVSMEYISGGTLSSLRCDQPNQVFSVADLGKWVTQLCAALDYAHQDAEVVHRDLKPANLMVDGKGRLRILDFGIAASISDSVSRVSQQAGSSGTPVYMSPQQMMGEDPAPTDDLYAVGATLFELLTGKPPFHAGNIMLQVQSKVAPRINERRKALNLEPVPAAWEDTIAACLAKDPAERPQSGAELLQRLGGDVVAAPQPKATPAAVASRPPVSASPGDPPPVVADLPGATTSGLRRWLIAPLLAPLPIASTFAVLVNEVNKGEASGAGAFLVAYLMLAPFALFLIGLRRPWRFRGSVGMAVFGALLTGLLGWVGAIFDRGPNEVALGLQLAGASLGVALGALSGWLLYYLAARATLLPKGPVRDGKVGWYFAGLCWLGALVFFGQVVPADVEAYRAAKEVREAQERKKQEEQEAAKWKPVIVEAHRMVFDREPDATTIERYLKEAKNNPWWKPANVRDAMRNSEEGRKGGRVLVPQEFPKIQEAIRAASAGNVVVVAPGTYEEDLYIDKAVTLLGAGRDQVTVAHDAGSSVMQIGEGVTAAKVSGFTFKHTTKTGAGRRFPVAWIGGQDVEFSRNAVIDADGHGVSVNKAQNMRFLDNVVAGSSWGGIALQGSVSGVIGRNTVRNNGQQGIYTGDQPGELAITDNIVSNNKEAGIFLAKAEGVEITGNELTGNGTDNEGGLGLGAGAGRPVLRNNRASANKGAGIWWSDEANPPVIGPDNISDGKVLTVPTGAPTLPATMPTLEKAAAKPVVDQARVYLVNEVDSIPRPVTPIQPKYPAAALRAELEGSVVVDYIVAADGTVEKATHSAEAAQALAAGQRDFISAALAAVKEKQFTPAKLRGVPVRCAVRQVIRFKLN